MVTPATDPSPAGRVSRFSEPGVIFAFEVTYLILLIAVFV